MHRGKSGSRATANAFRQPADHRTGGSSSPPCAASTDKGLNNGYRSAFQQSAAASADGAGAVNADPRVLRAMSSQLIGQYDPAMTHYERSNGALSRGVPHRNRWRCWWTAPPAQRALRRFWCRPFARDKVLVPVFAASAICCSETLAAAGRSAYHRGAVGRGVRLPRIRWRMPSNVFVPVCC